MPKFFNIGEPQCPPLPKLMYEIYEKVDGSLGIFWFDYKLGSWRCTTRGSFDNDFTRFALDWWNEYVDHKMVPKRFTIMAEICFKDDPMARAAHHDEGLYMVAIRDNYSGHDIRPSGTKSWGLLRAGDMGSLTIGEIQKRRDTEEGTEGWVVRYSNGLRVKVKTLWYLRIFKALNSLNVRTISGLVTESKENWLYEIPDDLREEAAEIWNDFESEYRKRLRVVYAAYAKLAILPTRKEFAIAAKETYPGIVHWLFQLLDSNDIEEGFMADLVKRWGIKG